MRNVFSVVLILLAGLVLISGALWAGDDMEKLRQQLEKLNAELAQANVDGNLEKLYSYYADDAVFMPNYGPMVKGKAPMMQQEKEMRDAGFKIHSFTLNTLDVWGCGDMVYETGTYNISLTIPQMDNPIDDTGKYLAVWQKGADGSLKIKYDMWNTDMNPWMMGENGDDGDEE